MERLMEAVEGELAVIKNVLSHQMVNIGVQKADLVDQLDSELTKHKLMMMEIIESAKKEFHGMQVSMKNLYEEAGLAFAGVKERLNQIEKKYGNGMRGYIPTKSLVSGAFSDKVDEWRQWQDDVMDYFDNVNPGMKDFLKKVELETEVVNESWVRRTNASVESTEEFDEWRSA